MTSENKRIHVYYSGRVQGVGFRFSVQAAAVDLGLSGWVRNLPDGKVEFLCEGREEDLHKILDKIGNEFFRHIRQKELNWMPASGEFTNFEIRLF